MPYLVTFEGETADLVIGSPVLLRGFTVSKGTSTQLVTDPNTGKVTTPVLLLLDPTRFHFSGGVRRPTVIGGRCSIGLLRS